VSVLIKVRGVLPNLRPAQRRVAEAVLAEPAGISESSITAVARRCQTSETTVLRFCRASGLAGYPELRIALARAAQFEEADHEISPIAAVSDLVLTTAARETTFSTGAMSSRIAQFAVVDCLFAGVAQRSYDRAMEALHSTYEVVQTRHAARV